MRASELHFGRLSVPLGQLAKVTESELKKLHGIGPNALKQLCAALEARDWLFARER